VDLIDQAGNGAVCIWSYGLPFLPGLASRARGGSPVPPASRPSWTLSVFKDGKPDFYLLSELDPSECVWDPEQGYWRFGDTHFRSTITGDRVALEIEYQATAPGLPGTLRGSLCASGPRRQSEPEKARQADHSWEPLTLGAATGQLQIHCGDYEAKLSGRAYYDRNAGDRPLHALGIQDWYWGRFPFKERELVVYLLMGEEGSDQHYVLEIDRHGELHHWPEASLAVERWARSTIRSRYPQRLRVQAADQEPVEITLQPPMDDSPFYRRFVARCSHAGSSTLGVFEHVLPHEIDPGWMRPLVQMRIHHTSRPNSIWLPLFSGPQSGRWGRLLRSWAGQTPPEDS
jgi:carotenoid 1,2-hydratase